MSYARKRRRAMGRRAMGATAMEYGLNQSATIVLAPTPPPKPAKLMPGSHVRIAPPARGVQAFGGVSSRPYGPSITRGLGDGPPAWYQAMYGASLGDDTANATPVLTDGTAQWQAAMLDQTKQLAQTWSDYTKKDQIARYVQVAATLMIPLSAAIWRMIFKSGRGDGG